MVPFILRPTLRVYQNENCDVGEDYREGYYQSMLNAGVLTFKEFAMREPLPLATIHEAVLSFCAPVTT